MLLEDAVDEAAGGASECAEEAVGAELACAFVPRAAAHLGCDARVGRGAETREHPDKKIILFVLLGILLILTLTAFL